MIDPSGGKRVTLQADVGFEERLISCKALHTVVNARMDETFRVLRSSLTGGAFCRTWAQGSFSRGAAYLRKVTDLAQRVFGLPCRIGLPINVDGLETVEQPAALSTAAGLALYGRLTYADRGLFSPLKNLFKGVFHR